MQISYSAKALIFGSTGLFTFLLSDSCKGGLNVPQGQSRTFTCTRSLQGRYVTIRKTGTAYLTLCEVQVFPLAGKSNLSLFVTSSLLLCFQYGLKMYIAVV